VDAAALARRALKSYQKAAALFEGRVRLAFILLRRAG